MKTKFLLFVLLFFAFGCGKKDNVPDEVKAGFDSKYASATDISWDREESDLWEASFTQNGDQLEAIFDADGNWVETGQIIDKETVPGVVLERITNDYGEMKIDQVDKIIDINGISYEFELEGKGLEKEVLVGSDGSIISNRSDENEDDDDEDSETDGNDENEVDDDDTD